MEGGIRKSVRVNLGIPPKRYGESSLDGQLRLPVKNTMMTQQKIDGDFVEDTTVNVQNFEKSIISGNGCSKHQSEGTKSKKRSSRKCEDDLEAREIELKQQLIDLQIKKLYREKEALSRSIGSKSTNSEKSSYFNDECSNDKHDYIKNWVRDVDEQMESHEIEGKIEVEHRRLPLPSIAGENSAERQNQTMVDCMKQLNLNLEKLVNKQSISQLQNFYGNVNEFPFWLEEFRRTTVEKGLSNSENMSRLQYCLKGKARDLVRDLFCSTENVESIIDTLTLNFGRSDWIIINQIEKARRCANPREDSVETFLQFSVTVSNMVISMVNIGNGKYLENPDLLMKLEEKLPRNSRRAWAQQKIKQDEMKCGVNLKDFSDWLKTEVNLLMSVSTSSQVYTYQNKQILERKEKIMTIVKKKSEICGLCKLEYHKLFNCKVFLEKSVDDRIKYVQAQNLCYKCLNAGHTVKKCFSKTFCNVDKCRRKHNRLLHTKRDFIEEKSIFEEQNQEEIKEERDSSEFVGHMVGKSSAILKVIKVKLVANAESFETYALLDEGSTVTLIDGHVARKLKLEGPVVPVCLQWTNQITHSDNNSMVVNFEIVGEKKTFRINSARVIQNLLLPEQDIDSDYLCDKYQYLDRHILKSVEHARPKILIGQDNLHVMITREIIHPRYDQPAFSRTNLGWVVHGPYIASETRLNVNLCHHDEDYLSRMIEENFKIENSDPLNLPKLSKEDKKAVRIFEKTVNRIGERFEIGLPWREENIVLPESRICAFKRLKCMEKKMDQDAEFAEQYCNKINEYVNKGFAEKLSQKEIEEDNGKIWYLPHFGVKNVKKPGKLRFVFDAAAKSHHMSLNDFLFKGPDFYPSLVAILWRFREKKYAFCGDIRDMFHQVVIRKEDRSCQRFLFRGMERVQDPEVYQMKVAIFGAVCSPSIAQFVKNYNASQFQEEFPQIMKIMLEQHWVDDYLDCRDSVSDASKTIKQVIETHRRGGFQMVNWFSNSAEVLQTIPSEYWAKSCTMTLDSNHHERILGLVWNTQEDIFIFENTFKNIPTELLRGERIPTKREILRIVMTVFDPIGFLSPLVIKGRLVFQECWARKIEWDDSVPEDVFNKWQEWCRSLKILDSLKIPRHNFSQSPKEVQLHVYCDASNKAFSAIAYFRAERDETFEISMISSKCKLGPLNKVTSVPRMELNGAVIAARLGYQIEKEATYKIIKKVYWTDSEIVLKWIRSETCKLKSYEAHRVEEISQLTDVSEWKWLPSKMNPADLATKEGTQLDFSPDSMWFQGPYFLKYPESEWPKETSVSNSNNQELVCLITKKSLLLPDTERFSKWFRLIRATAWMFRFLKNTRKKEKNKNPLSPEEIEDAEIVWWKKIQNEHFHKEIEILNRGKEITKKDTLWELSPFIDHHGILRMDSRIKYANVAFDTKFPIILPPSKKEKWVDLLIGHYHELVHHIGHETVINNLRQKFWIIKMRQSVKMSIRNCQFCKVKRARPRQPEMAPLPESRMKPFTRPFSYTGVDYFGPLLVKVKRSQEKRYGALFTCMNTRAVHIEIAKTLTTDSFFMALQRFISRRGQPLEIHSDNGTNFVGAENELKKNLEDLDHNKINAQLSKYKIKWIFNCPAAPFMGGVWERMVQSIKKILYTTLKEQTPSEELLHTLLLEAEKTVNTRPISYVSCNNGDMDSLTPMHFLIGSANSENLPGIFRAGDLYGRKQWRISQYMADQFWRRWLKEYLPRLQKRSKWYQKIHDIKTGEVIALPNDSSRNHWKLGRVTKIFPGRDGHIRSVEISTSTGRLVRPVNGLMRLEVGEC